MQAEMIKYNVDHVTYEVKGCNMSTVIIASWYNYVALNIDYICTGYN